MVQSRAKIPAAVEAMATLWNLRLSGEGNRMTRACVWLMVRDILVIRMKNSGKIA